MMTDESVNSNSMEWVDSRVLTKVTSVPSKGQSLLAAVVIMIGAKC